MESLPEHLLFLIQQHCELNAVFTLLAVSKHMQHAAVQYLGSHVKGVRVHRPASTPKHNQPGSEAHWLGISIRPQHGLPALRCILCHCRSLTALNLSSGWDWVGSEALKVLGTCAPCTLTHLCLERCTKVEPSGLQALHAGPALVKSLQYLSLHGCGSTGPGTDLGALTHLTHLDCSWCTDLTSEAVSKVCRHLTHAHFRGCDLLDDQLCAAFKCAQLVDLSYTRVTDHGLLTLASLPSLRALILAARTDNIYSSGLWTDLGLAMIRRQRPDLEVKLI